MLPPAPVPRRRGERLSDGGTALAIRFVHSLMVNTFKGNRGEFLAARLVAKLVQDPQARGTLPPETTAFAGDLVRARTASGETRAPDWAKGRGEEP